MKVSVIVPAHNEQATISELLHRVIREFEFMEGEIIVVDDGSTDATVELARAVAGVKVISQTPAQGKGAAVRLGLQAAQGEIILIQDADLEYDPSDYPQLVKPILAGQAEVVYGSRILGRRQGRSTGVSKRVYYWGGRVLSWLTTLLYGARMTDVATGYKVFRASLLKNTHWAANGFEFCPEITAKLLKQGISIHEVPIAYAPRTFAEGKKIRWTDGIVAIWTLIKIRFSTDEGR